MPALRESRTCMLVGLFVGLFCVGVRAHQEQDRRQHMHCKWAGVCGGPLSPHAKWHEGSEDELAKARLLQPQHLHRLQNEREEAAHQQRHLQL